MKKTIVYSAIIAGLLIGCGSDKKTETNEAVTKPEIKIESKKDNNSNAINTAKESAKKVAESTKSAIEKAKEATTEAVKKVEEAAKPVVEKAKEAATPVVEKATQVATQAVKKVKTAVAPSVDGKALFTTCAGCHGQKGEKKALGMSQVIGGWDAAKTENALKGYKAGTYGGAMKGVMQGQAAKLDDAKIKALAQYISTLK